MPNETTIEFWPIPDRPWLLSREICRKMIFQIQDAMLLLLSTGVAEYHVGSRGVKRFSMRDLNDLLQWWQWQSQTTETGSAIIAKRAVPTDT
jgi:hypothetical protein